MSRIDSAACTSAASKSPASITASAIASSANVSDATSTGSSAVSACSSFPPGGFDPKLFVLPIEDVSPELICAVCLHVVRDAVNLQCTHLMCRTCVVGLPRDDTINQQQRCPQCATPIDDKGSNAFANGRVAGMQIRCDNVGCTDKPFLMGLHAVNLVNHRLRCASQLNPCPACAVPVQRRDVARHIAEECDEREVLCPTCVKQTNVRHVAKRVQYADGRWLCPNFQPCPNSCRSLTSDDHLSLYSNLSDESVSNAADGLTKKRRRIEEAHSSEQFAASSSSDLPPCSSTSLKESEGVVVLVMKDRLQAHLRVCPERLISCDVCAAQLPQKSLLRHCALPKNLDTHWILTKCSCNALRVHLTSLTTRLCAAEKLLRNQSPVLPPAGMISWPSWSQTPHMVTLRMTTTCLTGQWTGRVNGVELAINCNMAPAKAAASQAICHFSFNLRGNLLPKSKDTVWRNVFDIQLPVHHSPSAPSPQAACGASAAASGSGVNHVVDSQNDALLALGETRVAVCNPRYADHVFEVCRVPATTLSSKSPRPALSSTIALPVDLTKHPAYEFVSDSISVCFWFRRA